MTKKLNSYLGRLFRDEDYEHAKAEYERYQRKYPDWEISLAKFKGRSPDGLKTDWHLQLWKEEDV